MNLRFLDPNFGVMTSVFEVLNPETLKSSSICLTFISFQDSWDLELSRGVLEETLVHSD